MIIDDFMFHVSKGWYRLYWGIMVAINMLVLAGCAATAWLPQFGNIGQQLNLDSMATVALSVITLGYLLVLYWVVLRKGMAFATLLGTMANALVLLNGITNIAPDQFVYVYIALWLLTTALNGIYGLPVLLGSALVSGIYVLLQSKFYPADITTESWVILCGSAVFALAAYPFWRDRFINPQDQKVSRLSGMLKTNQEQSATLIQSIADGVIVTDTTGKISLINQAAANMTGWTVDEAMGVEVKSVLKVAKEKGEPISEEEYPFTAVLVHKAFINQVLQLTSRKGKKQVVSLVISPVVTPTGEVYGAVAVLRDISEERAAEQQRAEFISTASHEMRTPVAAIEGYLSLALNEKVSTIDSRARGYLEKAHASTEHLGKLFQDLLTSAKAEDGRLSSHPQVVEMGNFLEQLVDDFRFSAQKKSLLAEFVVGSNNDTIDATNDDGNGLKMVKPLYYVFADPERLREVITNLFDNAVKYTDQGKISLGLTGNNEVVQVYVRDTGAGIPTEDIPHLFQKFYRVDNSATRVIGGTGLGLFICRKIVELYNGRIWVESDLGKGSTFFINLPRLSTQKANALQASEASAGPAPVASSTSTGNT